MKLKLMFFALSRNKVQCGRRVSGLSQYIEGWEANKALLDWLETACFWEPDNLRFRYSRVQPTKSALCLRLSIFCPGHHRNLMQPPCEGTHHWSSEFQTALLWQFDLIKAAATAPLVSPIAWRNDNVNIAFMLPCCKGLSCLKLLLLYTQQSWTLSTL